MYYSMYTPGKKIVALARRHHVRLVNKALGTLPKVMRERNRRFRFYELTREQHDVMMERFRRGSLASRTT